MELICIVCPRSCRITVDGDKITGNTCKRGEQFAREESVAPKRTLTSTVATEFNDFPVLPVRTDGEILKSQITEAMKIINGVCVKEKLKMGDVVIENLLGSGVNVIATESVITAKNNGRRERQTTKEKRGNYE